MVNKNSKGRPALISDKAFLEVHAKCASVEQVVDSFAVLRHMDRNKAKLYVSMRACMLRKAGQSVQTFKRGRKPSKPIQLDLPFLPQAVEAPVASQDAPGSTIVEQVNPGVSDEAREQARALMRDCLARGNPGVAADVLQGLSEAIGNPQVDMSVDVIDHLSE